MRRSEWLARVLVLFVAAYSVVAVITYSHVVWPFFAWNLFTKVPTPVSGDYNIRIVAVQGVRAKTPVYFEDARPRTTFGQLIQGYQTLQNWGNLTRQGKHNQAEVVRERFESIYLTDLSQVRYEFVHRAWDIRKRVDCRTCFIDVTVLDTYTTR
jgi:hypothetical protein